MYIIRKTKNLLSQAIPLFLQNYFAIKYWEQLDFDSEYVNKFSRKNQSRLTAELIDTF